MRTEAVDGIARRVAFSIFLEKASGGRSLLESRPAYRDFDSQNNSWYAKLKVHIFFFFAFWGWWLEELNTYLTQKPHFWENRECKPDDQTHGPKYENIQDGQTRITFFGTILG